MTKIFFAENVFLKLVHHIIDSQAFRWNWLACLMCYVNCIINYLSLI